MTYRMHSALVASLSAVALLLAANQTFARSGAAHGGGFTSTHSAFHPRVAQSLRHHRRNNDGTFWPAAAAYDYGPSNGEPVVEGTPPASGDIHTTYTYDVPWDWAHRYPPAVAPSDHPYVSSCPTETVRVRGHSGEEQTVNVMRCY